MSLTQRQWRSWTTACSHTAGPEGEAAGAGEGAEGTVRGGGGPKVHGEVRRGRMNPIGNFGQMQGPDSLVEVAPSGAGQRNVHSEALCERRVVTHVARAQ
jgi:hypothetical protein